jgi:hypothetical protein
MNEQLMIEFETTKNDNVYRFIIPTKAPLGEVYDAVHELLREIVKRANDSVKASEQKKDE